jgi:aminomethyltransferase
MLCNPYGGVWNDPILLHVKDDEWWFSVADSDIGMYLQGVNCDHRFDCTIHEIDAAPVALQGPKAKLLVMDLFGPDSDIAKLKYYECAWGKLNVGGAELEVCVSSSGFSGEMGYEIYLMNATRDADLLWNHILEKGEKYNLKVPAVAMHSRIEGGMLSYGQDIDLEVNPFECGQGWQVDLKKDDFVGKKALAKIKAEGVTHKLAGLLIHGGKPIEWYNADFYHVLNEEEELIGYVTSAWYSPGQGKNIALAMLPVEYTGIGTELSVALPKRYSDVPTERCTVEKTPFKLPVNAGAALRMQGSKI